MTLTWDQAIFFFILFGPFLPFVVSGLMLQSVIQTEKKIETMTLQTIAKSKLEHMRLNIPPPSLDLSELVIFFCKQNEFFTPKILDIHTFMDFRHFINLAFCTRTRQKTSNLRCCTNHARNKIKNQLQQTNNIHISLRSPCLTWVSIVLKIYISHFQRLRNLVNEQPN